MFGADPSYKVPRTADGRPDLQGVWSNNSVTPMTRPTQWKDKALLTDAELGELKTLIAQSADDGGDAIFQNQVQLALDAKEKGKFEQISYDKATARISRRPCDSGSAIRADAMKAIPSSSRRRITVAGSWARLRTCASPSGSRGSAPASSTG
jgi:hypothetical protein